MYHIMLHIRTEILVAMNIKTDILGCDIDHLPNYAESLPESLGRGLYIIHVTDIFTWMGTSTEEAELQLVYLSLGYLYRYSMFVWCSQISLQSDSRLCYKFTQLISIIFTMLYVATLILFSLQTEQKPIILTHTKPKRCQIIDYFVLSNGTYSVLSSYRQFFVTAPILGLYD
jgi:hypothetical protein